MIITDKTTLDEVTENTKNTYKMLKSKNNQPPIPAQRVWDCSDILVFDAIPQDGASEYIAQHKSGKRKTEREPSGWWAPADEVEAEKKFIDFMTKQTPAEVEHEHDETLQKYIDFVRSAKAKAIADKIQGKPHQMTVDEITENFMQDLLDGKFEQRKEPVAPESSLKQLDSAYEAEEHQNFKIGFEHIKNNIIGPAVLESSAKETDAEQAQSGHSTSVRDTLEKQL